MQRKQIWLLNAVLAAAALFMAWQLRTAWRRGNERYARLVPSVSAAATAYIVPPSAPPATLQTDIVAKNIFSPDRNNDVARPVAVAAPPPLPIVIGTMQLGAAREALMSEAGARGFRRVKAGEEMGGYKVVEVADESVTVEFQGKETTINVYQSAKSVARAEAVAPMQVQQPAASAGPVVDSVASTPPPVATQPIPAPTPTAPSSGLQPGVRVTIEGNRRRFEKDTAFGPQVWYEEIK